MLLWGSLFPMVKLGYDVYEISSTGDILFFAGLRFSVCGAAICIFALFVNKASFADAKTSIPGILLVGLFSIILHYGFTYTGLSLTDSGKTAIIKQIGALIYVCFSFLFFKSDRLTAKKLIGAALGFAGIIAINYGGGRISFGIGELLILLASFCTVFSNVISKKLPSRVAPVTMTGISQLFGGIVLLAAGLILGGGITFRMEKCFIFLYICMASVISYCIWFGIVKKSDLSSLFIIKFAEPIFACIFGAVILGENILKLQYLIALLLICAGILLSSIKTSDKAIEKNK